MLHTISASCHCVECSGQNSLTCIRFVVYCAITSGIPSAANKRQPKGWFPFWVACLARARHSSSHLVCCSFDVVNTKMIAYVHQFATEVAQPEFSKSLNQSQKPVAVNR